MSYEYKVLGNLILLGDNMKITIKNKMYEFKPFKAIFILAWIYIFTLTCPYWIDKAQVLTANEKKIESLPKEVMEKSAVWGNSLSPNNNLIIIPYGRKELTIYYVTNIYSMSGFRGAKPKIKISDGIHLKYTIKTVDPVSVENFPSVVENSSKVLPYLKIQLNSNRQLLHRIVKVKTDLVLEYPQLTSYRTFNYFSSNVIREFSLFFVSPDEMPMIKKHFKKDLPEGVIVPYLIGAVSVFFFVLIIINLKLVFNKIG